MSQGFTSGVPIDADVNLGGGSASNQLVPSQLAVKTYVDAAAGASATSVAIPSKPVPW